MTMPWHARQVRMLNSRYRTARSSSPSCAAARAHAGPAPHCARHRRKPRLEAARRPIHKQQRSICLRGPTDHVGHKVSVAWRIEEGDVETGGGKAADGDVDCHAAGALLWALVEHPRPGEGRLRV